MQSSRSLKCSPSFKTIMTSEFEGRRMIVPQDHNRPCRIIKEEAKERFFTKEHLLEALNANYVSDLFLIHFLLSMYQANIPEDQVSESEIYQNTEEGCPFREILLLYLNNKPKFLGYYGYSTYFLGSETPSQSLREILFHAFELPNRNLLESIWEIYPEGSRDGPLLQHAIITCKEETLSHVLLFIKNFQSDLSVISRKALEKKVRSEILLALLKKGVSNSLNVLIYLHDYHSRYLEEGIKILHDRPESFEGNYQVDDRPKMKTLMIKYHLLPDVQSCIIL